MTTLATSQSFDSFPIWCFLSVVWIIFSIARLKLHPLAMIVVLFCGLLSGPLPEPTIENKGLFIIVLIWDSIIYSNLSHAVKWSLLGFGYCRWYWPYCTCCHCWNLHDEKWCCGKDCASLAFCLEKKELV